MQFTVKLRYNNTKIRLKIVKKDQLKKKIVEELHVRNLLMNLFYYFVLTSDIQFKMLLI